MKKMKKAAALMMTVAMMLSMAACGNSGAKETTGAAEGLIHRWHLRQQMVRRRQFIFIR